MVGVVQGDDVTIPCKFKTWDLVEVIEGIEHNTELCPQQTSSVLGTLVRKEYKTMEISRIIVKKVIFYHQTRKKIIEFKNVILNCKGYT